MPTHVNRIALSTIAICAAVSLVACGNNNKEVSFKSGGMTHTFSEGSSSIPGDFPLPIYPNATATGSVSSQNDKSHEDAKFLLLSVSEDYQKVGQFYQDKLKEGGWKIETIQSMPNVINIGAEKGDLEASVMIAADPGQKTTVSLAVSKEGSGDNQDVDQSNENYSPDKITPPTD